MKRVRPVVVGVAALALASAAGATDPWSPPAGFYDTITDTGATLKAQLSSRMLSGHIQRTYGDFRFASQFFDTDPDNPANILLVYNRASVLRLWDSGVTWNREHVWPQSRQPGSVSNSSLGNLGDHHALRPANPSINGSRGNLPFAFPSTVGGFGSLGTFWFPGDSDKGDIARSLFYSDTRWGPSLGIALVNGAPGTNQMGDLASLVAWHYLDPPDEFERRRNHVIFSQDLNPSFHTDNRNAYVDLPETVWSVYVDQANDSQLFVGDAPAPDGSSAVVVVVGPAIVGTPGPITETVTLSRSGFDGAYFEIATVGEGFAVGAGRHNAFPVNSTGSDVRLLEVGVDSATMSAPGLKTGEVWIDNLDVTAGAGAGRAANDADDLIMVELAVLDHANASLAPGADADSVTIDLGAIERFGGDRASTLTIHNLEATPGFTAALDVFIDEASGDTGAITLGPSALFAIGAGGSGDFTITLDDAAVGAFSATYTLSGRDDMMAVGGAITDTLTVTITGEVAAPGCVADLTGDSVVDGADLGLLLGAWGSGAGPADLTGDGAVDGADLGLLLGAWGACG